MTYLVALLLIVALAAVVAAPFLSSDSLREDALDGRDTERLEREKGAALLAIREAQFDRAMGKLSEEDYLSLRSFYERRALNAMAELPDATADQPRPQPTTAVAFCSGCGRQFAEVDRFCGTCGRPRGAAPL